MNEISNLPKELQAIVQTVQESRPITKLFIRK